MRVLITGGSGVLAAALSHELTRHGHDVTLLDIKKINSPYKNIIADIRDSQSMLSAMKNQDVVVHTAALHGIHKGAYSDYDFLDVNILGMCNVLNAARQHGVSRVIYTSSTSVYGVSKKNAGTRAVYINENTPRNPIDINDLTKMKGELLCNYFREEYGLDCISLRIGRFFKGDDWIDYNLTKLYGGIDPKDVVQGIRLAIEAGQLKDNVFCISSRTPFNMDDLDLLMGNADAVIEKYYPGSTDLFAKHDLQLPKTIHRIVDICRSVDQLGFNPNYNFMEFLDELRATNMKVKMS